MPAVVTPSPEEIFVVDDDAGFRALLVEFLTALGYSVRPFDSAEEVIAHLGYRDAALPRIVISDVRMGGVTGLELARSLRQRAPALPIVLMTGFGGREGARQAREAGAAAYLDKPFALDDMQQLVERLLGPTH